MTAFLDYNQRDWYWFAGGDETQVWSSARSGFFPIDDIAYLAWLESGGATYSTDQDAFRILVNTPIIAAIQRVEMQQARPLRELQLGVDVEDNHARLADMDEDISTLRARMIS